MKATLEIFKERYFNSDLTGNTFDIVLGKTFHFGLDYSNSSKLVHIVFQTKERTYFLGIWFNKSSFEEYFQGYRLTETYRTIFLF
jgi:hypothetical protein